MNGGLPRRDLLGVAGGLIALGLLDGCSGGEPVRTDQIAIPLRDLAAGKRRIVVIQGNPVEVLRTASGASARMLRCTHMGCVVHWREQEQVYACPCHDGRYDENGNVIAGPPPFPLRAVPAVIRHGRVLVGRSVRAD